MDDLIFRGAAIEALCRGEGCGNICRRAIERIPPAQRWIPVTERLPEEERNIYWVYTDFGSMHECRWTNNRFGLGESDTWGWSIFDVPQHSKVTHWRELPEPPEEEP